MPGIRVRQRYDSKSTHVRLAKSPFEPMVVLEEPGVGSGAVQALSLVCKRRVSSRNTVTLQSVRSRPVQYSPILLTTVGVRRELRKLHHFLSIE